jgi:L-malate glycosyltransferase
MKTTEIMSFRSNPIKVIFVIYKFTADGSSIALLNLLDGLADKEISPLIIMSKRGSLCSELEKRSIPYLVIPYYLSRYYKFGNPLINILSFIPLMCYLQLLNIIATYRIARAARSFNANIIHTNIGPLQIGYKAANKAGIPHVWHIREYQGGIFSMKPFPSLTKFKEKLHSSYSIAISKGIYNYYSLSEKAKVIYDGVLKSTQTQFKADKKKYFLFVGQLQQSKGIEQLIDGYIEFAKHNSEYELYLAGWGKESYVSKLKAKIITSGNIDRTHFLGPRRDVFDLMSIASAVIVSSLSEGFGFVAAEAMFNGSLVIGYNATGTKEQIENGLERHKKDIALKYSNQKELVIAMEDIAKNGVEYYFPMIMRAQETASALYSQERHAAEVYDFYLDILSKTINRK